MGWPDDRGDGSGTRIQPMTKAGRGSLAGLGGRMRRKSQTFRHLTLLGILKVNEGACTREVGMDREW